MLFHTLGIFTISKSQSYVSILITKNTPYQRKGKCGSAFLGDRNFIKDKNGNRALDKGIGRVTVKILHFHDVRLKRRQKAAEDTKQNASKRIPGLMDLQSASKEQVSIPAACPGDVRVTLVTLPV